MPKIAAVPVNQYYARGTIGGLFSYSVTEDATPLNPADSSGSVGQITLPAIQTDGDQYMLGEKFILTDPARGKVHGIARSVAAAGGRTTFTAESALGALNTERLMPPYVGTLAGAFVFYLGAVGIDQVGFGVDGQLFTIIAPDATYLEYPVAYPGWKGNVWEHVKMMNAATGSETALVGGMIVLRPAGGRSIDMSGLKSVGTSVSASNAAQSIEIYNYNTRAATGATETVFTADSPYNVGVGEVNKFRVTLDVSLTQVFSPDVQTSILGPNPTRPLSGAYAVSGSNGKPVPVQWWIDNGGKIRVALTENPFEIEITITGPRSDYLMDTENYAPFRIAEGEAAYPALYVGGMGVFTSKELITLKTGASPKTTSTLVGATIDNPFLTNRRETLTAGLRAACAYAGRVKTLNFAVKNYDRGQQEFGNIAGSMAPYGTSMYRVKSSSIDAENISGSADSFVTVADVNTTFAGKTFGQVNAIFDRMTFGDQSLTPLKAA